MSKKKQGGFVYSTNPDYKIAEEIGEQNTPDIQELRIWLEKAGRGGKIASVIKGFIGSAAALDELGRVLKSKCGTGGSSKEGEIIIQGDHRDKLLKILIEMGHKAKKAGG